MTEQTQIEKVSDFMRSEGVKERFAEIVGGNNVGAYISSVLLAVADSRDLQACTIASVYISAMRAATLHLSVDPGTGQAYLVPFKDKATLIVGYKGLMDMAVRTGKYRYINVGPVYEGEIVHEDRISGFHSIDPESRAVSKVIIGYLGAFQLYSGYSKTLYMTVDEIHAHAKKYSRVYDNPRSFWQKDPGGMEKKTVLRLLLRRWGYIDPADTATLESIETEHDNAIEVEPEDLDAEQTEPEPDEPQITEQEHMNALGFDEPKMF